MLGLIVFLYLLTVGNILSQDIVVLQVKTESVVVLLNNTRLNERSSNTSLTADLDTGHRIKKPETTPFIVETDQKKELNFIENKIMSMFNKVDNQDHIKVNKQTNETKQPTNKTSVPGIQKPTGSGVMNATELSLASRTGFTGDMCTKGYVKVDGNCVKEMK